MSFSNNRFSVKQLGCDHVTMGLSSSSEQVLEMGTDAVHYKLNTPCSCRIVDCLWLHTIHTEPSNHVVIVMECTAQRQKQPTFF